MKKYTSLGALLKDYREDNNVSQLEFATNVGVDIRTVQRWEHNESYIRPEKEKDVINETLLPYQLIRNLNSSIPIPTFYDFTIRKYSLSPLNNKLPKASWFKSDSYQLSNHIMTIRNDEDIDLIIRSIELHNHTPNPVNKTLIRQAIKLLPELNLIIFDDFGYYAGHSITFPISEVAFKKLKNREISEVGLQLNDLLNYRQAEKSVFYSYDITGDCNDSIFYISHYFLNFFSKFQEKNYTYCSFSVRHDSDEVNEELGLKIIWEDLEEQKERNLEAAPRLYVGDFKDFILDK